MADKRFRRYHSFSKSPTSGWAIPRPLLSNRTWLSGAAPTVCYITASHSIMLAIICVVESMMASLHYGWYYLYVVILIVALPVVVMMKGGRGGWPCMCVSGGGYAYIDEGRGGGDP